LLLRLFFEKQRIPKRIPRIGVAISRPSGAGIAQSGDEEPGRSDEKWKPSFSRPMAQCALVAKRYSQYLQQFYQRIQRRRGKFLGFSYHTLKNNWVFADFRNFVLVS
jgi:hypothetical protein